MRETLVRAIRLRASARSSGGSASALSLITSTAVPPWPKTMTGPNVGSSATPTISSRAFGRTIMGKTVTPSIRASGFAARARLKNVRRGLTHVLLGDEAEPDAADLRFVDDVGRQNLQDDRVARGKMRLGRRDGLIGIARQHRRRNGNAIGREQLGHFDGIEPSALVGQYAVDDRPHGLSIRREILRHAGRRRHQLLARFAGTAPDA